MQRLFRISFEKTSIQEIQPPLQQTNERTNEFASSSSLLMGLHSRSTSKNRHHYW
jgi:hypothetical protein